MARTRLERVVDTATQWRELLLEARWSRRRRRGNCAISYRGCWRFQLSKRTRVRPIGPFGLDMFAA
jgi:hypothetical protein